MQSQTFFRLSLGRNAGAFFLRELRRRSPPKLILFLNRPERCAFNSGSFVMFAAIRRASSPKVLEIKYGRWGFQQELT
jgi:hypothetical protein